MGQRGRMAVLGALVASVLLTGCLHRWTPPPASGPNDPYRALRSQLHHPKPSPRIARGELVRAGDPALGLVEEERKRRGGLR